MPEGESADAEGALTEEFALVEKLHMVQDFQFSELRFGQRQ